jgi:hypothetical protein
MTAPEQPAGARWPDFFIVGHHKSGTTAMYQMLRRHPQIYMPELKEPRFMASDLRSRRPPERNRHPETAEDYLALFDAARAEQRVGEASATYLFSHTAAERIAAVQPGAKIIAILREPASFLRSLHLTYVNIHFEDESDLRRAIALETARRANESVPPRAFVPQLLQYSEQTRYVEQLRRYEARFAPAQMLVLIYDDFRDDNAAALRRVHEFLEVDADQRAQAADANVTSWSYRSQHADALLSSAALGRSGLWRPAKAAVKLLSSKRIRRMALSSLRRRVVLSEPAPPDEQLMGELRRRFKPEVVALSDHLGRDLVSLWGYDEL